MKKIFNNHYINIVENSRGRKPLYIAHNNNIDDITLAIKLIIKIFENHPSICKIIEHYSNNQATMTSLSLETTGEVKNLLGAISPNKAGFINIPPT